MRVLIFHRVRIILGGIALFAAISGNAQQSNTFYLLHDVPQSNLLNPAVQISCRWFAGIPGLSSTHVSYGNTAFTYKDLTENNSWNLESVEEQMHRVDLYTAEVNLHLLSLGYRHKSFYFNFSVNERAHLYQTVPKDLATLGIYGNGPFAGEQASINPLRSLGTYFRAYNFGVSKVLSHSLTAGIRAKVLFGKAGVSTATSDMSLHTEENSFGLRAEGDYLLNGSLPVSIEQDNEGNISGISLNEINYAQFLLNRGNPGMALDLGLIYRYNEKLTLSASLLDLGMIRWRTDLNTISATGEFIFVGIDPADNVASMTYLEQMLDSLQNSFSTSVVQNPYNALLPMQLYLGGSYLVNEHISVGIVNRNLFFRSKLHSSVTLQTTADLKEKFQASLSWSYLNNSIRNIGAALVWRGPGFQFHLVSDNLLGFMQPFDTRTINLRAGFNIMFGCPRNKKEAMEAASGSRRSMAGNCYWAEKQKIPKKRKRKLP